MANTNKGETLQTTDCIGLTEMQIPSYLESLDGQSFLSISSEAGVLIEGTKVWSNGEVIETIKTKKRAKELFDEMFEEEFGYAPGSKAMEKELNAEFGAAN